MVWNKWRSVSNCGVLLLGKKMWSLILSMCMCMSQGELKIPLLWHSSEAWLASQPLAGGHAVHGNETTTCPSETEVKWTSPLSPSHLHAICMSQMTLPSGSHRSCVCVHVLLNCSDLDWFRFKTIRIFCHWKCTEHLQIGHWLCSLMENDLLFLA